MPTSRGETRHLRRTNRPPSTPRPLIRHECRLRAEKLNIGDGRTAATRRPTTTSVTDEGFVRKNTSFATDEPPRPARSAGLIRHGCRIRGEELRHLRRTTAATRCLVCADALPAPRPHPSRMPNSRGKHDILRRTNVQPARAPDPSRGAIRRHPFIRHECRLRCGETRHLRRTNRRDHTFHRFIRHECRLRAEKLVICDGRTAATTRSAASSVTDAGNGRRRPTHATDEPTANPGYTRSSASGNCEVLG